MNVYVSERLERWTSRKIALYTHVYASRGSGRLKPLRIRHKPRTDTVLWARGSCTRLLLLSLFILLLFNLSLSLILLLCETRGLQLCGDFSLFFLPLETSHEPHVDHLPSWSGYYLYILYTHTHKHIHINILHIYVYQYGTWQPANARKHSLVSTSSERCRRRRCVIINLYRLRETRPVVSHRFTTGVCTFYAVITSNVSVIMLPVNSTGLRDVRRHGAFAKNVKISKGVLKLFRRIDTTAQIITTVSYRPTCFNRENKRLIVKVILFISIFLFLFSTVRVIPTGLVEFSRHQFAHPNGFRLYSALFKGFSK